MENFSGSKYEENKTNNLTGEKVNFDWDEIRKGILEVGEEGSLQKTQKTESSVNNSKNEDSLDQESFSRPSFSEIAESKKLNDAKKELEEMFPSFSGIVEKPKNLIEQEERETEMFDRFSGTETKPEEKEEIEPFFNPVVNQINIDDLSIKQTGPVYNKWQADSVEKLGEVEEKLNQEPNTLEIKSEKKPPIPEPPKEIEQVVETNETETKEERDDEEIQKIKTEKEIIVLKEKLGIPSEKKEGTPSTEREQSLIEKQKEKILGFIRGKKEQTETEFENLSSQKKTLFTKFVSLAKNRKVQAAVIGSALVGVSIMVPPVGGAAWLTQGIVSGFLPVEFGIPLKVAGGVVGGAILRKAIEFKNKKNGIVPSREVASQETIDQKSLETPIIVEQNEERGKDTEIEIDKQRKKIRSANERVNNARAQLLLAQNSLDLPEKEAQLFQAKKEFDEAFVDFAREMYLLAEKTEKTPSEILSEMYVGKKAESNTREVLPDIKTSPEENFENKTTDTNEQKNLLDNSMPKPKISDRIRDVISRAKEKGANEVDAVALKDKEEKEGPLTTEQKINLIKKSEDFAQIYKAIEEIGETEKNFHADLIISEIERIRNLINDPDQSIKEKKFIADLFTGNIKDEGDKNALYKPKTDIPELYEINDQINFLLKKEIDNSISKEKTSDLEKKKPQEQIIDTEKNKDEKEKALAINKTNSIEDLSLEIEKMGIEGAKEISAAIQELDQKITAGEGGILPVLAKIPEEYGIKKRVTSLIELQKNKKIKDYSGVSSFDNLFKNLSEAEKSEVQMIRIGYKEPRELESPLREAVMSLMAKDAKRIKGTTNLLDFYDTLTDIFSTVGTLNSFSANKIINSMHLYINPNKKNGRAEMLEEIPEIYGIRSKFLELIQKENILVAKGVSNEPALPKKTIEENPQIITEKPTPSITERIRSVAMKDVEREIEKVSTQEEFLETISKVQGLDIPSESELLTIIYNGIAGKNISDELDMIPNEYGIRDALERVIENEKTN